MRWQMICRWTLPRFETAITKRTKASLRPICSAGHVTSSKSKNYVGQKHYFYRRCLSGGKFPLQGAHAGAVLQDMAAFSFLTINRYHLGGAAGHGCYLTVSEEIVSVTGWKTGVMWMTYLKLGQRFAPMSFMDLVALQVKFSHLKENHQNHEEDQRLCTKRG